MNLRSAFWLIMLLWFLLSGLFYWRVETRPYATLSGLVWAFIALCILGWKAFGPALHQ